jgi:hypothetical protein
MYPCTQVHNVPKCTKMYPNVPMYPCTQIPKCNPVPKYPSTQMHPNVPNVPKCTHVLKYPNVPMFPSTQCVLVLVLVPMYSMYLCTQVPKCTHVPNVPKYPAFVLCMIQNMKEMISPVPEKVIYCYGEFQPVFFGKFPYIRFHEGLPDSSMFDGKPTLLVLDDSSFYSQQAH